MLVELNSLSSPRHGRLVQRRTPDRTGNFTRLIRGLEVRKSAALRDNLKRQTTPLGGGTRGSLLGGTTRSYRRAIVKRNAIVKLWENEVLIGVTKRL
jgi:hypothetical protein